MQYALVSLHKRTLRSSAGRLLTTRGVVMGQYELPVFIGRGLDYAAVGHGQQGSPITPVVRSFLDEDSRHLDLHPAREQPAVGSADVQRTGVVARQSTLLAVCAALGALRYAILEASKPAPILSGKYLKRTSASRHLRQRCSHWPPLLVPSKLHPDGHVIPPSRPTEPTRPHRPYTRGWAMDDLCTLCTAPVYLDGCGTAKLLSTVAGVDTRFPTPCHTPPR